MTLPHLVSIRLRCFQHARGEGMPPISLMRGRWYRSSLCNRLTTEHWHTPDSAEQWPLPEQLTDTHLYTNKGKLHRQNQNSQCAANLKLCLTTWPVAEAKETKRTLSVCSVQSAKLQINSSGEQKRKLVSYFPLPFCTVWPKPAFFTACKRNRPGTTVRSTGRKREKEREREREREIEERERMKQRAVHKATVTLTLPATLASPAGCAMPGTNWPDRTAPAGQCWTSRTMGMSSSSSGRTRFLGQAARQKEHTHTITPKHSKRMGVCRDKEGRKATKKIPRLPPNTSHGSSQYNNIQWPTARTRQSGNRSLSW